MLFLILYVSFFAVPAITVVLFFISLFGYLYAKKQNKAVPGKFSDAQIKNRKKMLIVLSVILGVFVTVVVGLTVLVFTGVISMM